MLQSIWGLCWTDIVGRWIIIFFPLTEMSLPSSVKELNCLWIELLVLWKRDEFWLAVKRDIKHNMDFTLLDFVFPLSWLLENVNFVWTVNFKVGGCCPLTDLCCSCNRLDISESKQTCSFNLRFNCFLGLFDWCKKWLNS